MVVVPVALLVPAPASHSLLGAAIHRIMQLHVLQSEIVLGIHLNRHFFDGRRLEVPAGPRQLDLRRMVLLRFDEVVLAQPHGLAAFQRSHVIHAVLENRDGGHQRAAGVVLEAQAGTVIQHQHAVRKRAIGDDLHIRLRAFHRAQVAARIFHCVLVAEPCGVVVRHPHFFHARHIHHIQLELLAAHAAGFHVIFQRFRDARDEELIGGAAGFGPHLRLLPRGGAVVFREEAHFRRGEAHQVGADHLVAALADGTIARFHLDGIIRFAHALRQSSPQQVGAVAHETRAAGGQPHQHQHGDRGGAGEPDHHGVRRHTLGLGMLRHIQGVGGKQFQKRIAGVGFGTLGEGEQPLLELREASLRLAGCVPPVEPDHRHNQCDPDGERNS